MTADERDDEAPPPILGSWKYLYLLEVVVLIILIAGFCWVGSVYR